MKKLRFIFVLLIMSAAIFVFAKISSKTSDFKQADDFPREALIYFQVQDLPSFIKLWKDSEISKKHLESTNFSEFQNNHLALKLIERANEMSDSLNIFPDLNLLSSLSENKAAAAIYDIGKMEFVFIAPMSEEKILASIFFQSKSDFEETKLADGTLVYSKEIDVDRARQKQKVLFTTFRGRFILATSEKFFLQTLENIKGETRNNRLSDETTFKPLAAKTKPNLATVWLNQNKLNDDWYFKHYWLMSDSNQLKNLRSGMFDFEVQEKKLVERRVFLTVENSNTEQIKAETANRISRFIPENVPFYQIQTVGKNNLDEMISKTVFDTENVSKSDQSGQTKEVYYFDDWEKSYRYSSPGSNFDEQINDIQDNENSLKKPADKTNTYLSKIVGEANPNVLLTILSPKTLPSPMFFENRNALIFSLQNPSKLNREKLETTLSKTAQDLFAVPSPNADFKWKDRLVDEVLTREMTMPSLGWQIFYILRQNELIFTNSEDLLKDVLAAKANQAKFDSNFKELTVIRLTDRQEIFDDVFKTIQNEENPNQASYFFTKNVGSLLDVVSDVERIEIKQNSEQNFLFEEIDFVLKEKPQ